MHGRAGSILGWFFLVMSLLLTGISMEAGFRFYEALFGPFVAAAATITFELLRLGSLVVIMDRTLGKRALGIVLYVMVVAICTFVNMTSFRAQIDERRWMQNIQRMKELKRRVELVQRARVRQIQEEMDGINEKIDVSRRMIARGINPEYYLQRIQQRQEDLAKLEEKLHSVQNVDTENESDMLRFLHENMPFVDENFGPLPAVQGGGSMVVALREMWRLDRAQAEGMVVVLLVLAVEAGIFLLVMISGAELDIISRFRAPDDMELLIRRYGRQSVERFMSHARPYYRRYRRLIPQNRLSAGLREIRQEVAGWSTERLEELFGVNHTRADFEALQDNGNGRTAVARVTE